MFTNFTANGIRFNIQFRPRTLREAEPEIQPDRSLWTNAAKKKLTGGLKDEPPKRDHHIRHGRSHHQYRVPKPEDFVDREEFR
jgi:hypothetical protein